MTRSEGGGTIKKCEAIQLSMDSKVKEASPNPRENSDGEYKNPQAYILHDVIFIKPLNK